MSQPAALLVASPLPARKGWYLEDVIRAPDVLGAVPLRREATAAGLARESTLERALYPLKPLLERVYSIDGLAQFKRQFPPHHWEDEYLLPRLGALSLAAPGLWHALLPQGLTHNPPARAEEPPRQAGQPLSLVTD